jgi:CheY-like chemotaxis protein
MCSQSLPILLVEDNPMDADLTVRSFVKRNLHNPILIARDGEEALEYLQRWVAGEPRPLAILLDINLPKVNGIEVLREYRANDLSKEIPVILLLSSENDKEVYETAQIGTNLYIIKPVSFEKFAQIIPQTDLCWLLEQRPAI